MESDKDLPTEDIFVSFKWFAEMHGVLRSRVVVNPPALLDTSSLPQSQLSASPSTSNQDGTYGSVSVVDLNVSTSVLHSEKQGSTTFTPPTKEQATTTSQKQVPKSLTMSVSEEEVPHTLSNTAPSTRMSTPTEEQETTPIVPVTPNQNL